MKLLIRTTPQVGLGSVTVGRAYFYEEVPDMSPFVRIVDDQGFYGIYARSHFREPSALELAALQFGQHRNAMIDAGRQAETKQDALKVLHEYTKLMQMFLQTVRLMSPPSKAHRTPDVETAQS